ncbi:MAG: metallophosphoesterase [Myxococcales bacterium]|nr:metallophosphoesterase [Myxococcales bacterium]
MTSCVRRIAHLSDLHLLSFANRGVSAGNTVRRGFVSLGRPLDPEARAAKALAAMRDARALGAEHLVLSGDLSELGLASELQVLADVLASSGFGPEAVTLVPGNHDRYAGPEEWATALAGPLAPWMRPMPTGVGACVDLGSVRLVPIDVTRPQSVMRSAGFVTDAIVEGLRRLLHDPGLTRLPVAVVLHHPPFALAPILHRLDGLIGCEELAALAQPLDQVQFLHGHLHRSVDREPRGGCARVLGAPAVVDRGDAFRVYDVTVDGLVPVVELGIAAA